MKKSIKNFSIFFLLLFGLMTYACSGGSNNASSSGAHGANADYTSAYVCPMHCKDSGSDKKGTCGVCGMDLVTLESHAKDGHKH